MKESVGSVQNVEVSFLFTKKYVQNAGGEYKNLVVEIVQNSLIEEDSLIWWLFE